MKTILFLAMLLTGCGSEVIGRHVNATLQAGVDRYFANAPNQGHWEDVVSVNYGTPKLGALGECKIENHYGLRERSVIILKVPEEDILLQVTVAHELGHCAHDKKHDDRGLRLMNTQRLGDAVYWEQNLDAQIRGLF